jgi:predicted RNA-binding Zn ribbon-like protein
MSQTTWVIRRTLTVYSEEVDGLVLPIGLGGHPAVDFCNTYAGWNEPAGEDYLQSYDHLAVWAAANGLIAEEAALRLRRRAARNRADAGAALRRALRLRTALYGLCLDPHPGSDWNVVAAEARAAASAAVLAFSEGEPEWRLPDGTGLALPRLAVARAAADLLTSGALGAVRPCPGRGCGWLFLDPSGRRRWCTMAICGNRAKVRRHHERSVARARGVLA